MRREFRAQGDAFLRKNGVYTGLLKPGGTYNRLKINLCEKTCKTENNYVIFMHVVLKTSFWEDFWEKPQRSINREDCLWKKREASGDQTLVS